MCTKKSVVPTIFLKSRFFLKVKLFWKGHKNVRNRPYGFEIYLVNVKTIRTIAQIFVAFSEKLNFTKFVFMIFFIHSLWHDCSFYENVGKHKLQFSITYKIFHPIVLGYYSLGHFLPWFKDNYAGGPIFSSMDIKKPTIFTPVPIKSSFRIVALDTKKNLISFCYLIHEIFQLQPQIQPTNIWFT